MKKLLLFFLLFVTTSCFSQINRGSDISYTYIGNTSNPYNYKITISTYETLISSIGNCELLVFFGDGDSSYVPRVNGPSSICSISADGIIIGGCDGSLRYSDYEISHNYSGPGNYMISTEFSGRDLGICNIPSGNESIFLQSELIISPFLGVNNGPDYNAVPAICNNVGVISYYNPLAIDSDGDSLYYELIPAMSFGGAVVGWIYPQYTSSFTINDTGTVRWDKPVSYCSYVFDIKITEWRNIGGSYYLIGKTMQEVSAEVGAFAGISDESRSSLSLIISPNPSNGLINYTIESQLQNQNYQMEISNSIGQIIKTVDITSNSGVINESELSAGIYFYSLRNNAEILNKGKFVILQGSMK